ncbi:ras GTPase-activating protein-binding protein 1 [Cydia strobilella]|uniref:ras GTPase-activating protein-binding protein 1 n=1 Tax=Cydia strobilella TaxID=1100964 RepID=UPI00300568D9
MVMEASPSPSPQSVGREFVRQYYTLLNKAPTHLHRFYNNYSSFVHGGLDAPHRETLPVVGQKQIHNRIQQLNFRDCHAKISQVDSQATLGNGVVVQVTGELSNGGAPMRRFTQTFVLAAQSPKKYYVHNDIFRYQDLVPEDEEPGSPAEPAGYFPPPPFPPAFPAPPALDEPTLNGHQPERLHVYTRGLRGYSPRRPSRPPSPRRPPSTSPHSTATSPSGYTVSIHEGTEGVLPPPPFPPAFPTPPALDEPTLNGHQPERLHGHPSGSTVSIHEGTEGVLPPPPFPPAFPTPPALDEPTLNGHQPERLHAAAPAAPVEPEPEPAPVLAPAPAPAPEPEPEPEPPREPTPPPAHQHQPQPAVPPEPKTYANLLKSSAPVSSAPLPAPAPAHAAPAPAPAPQEPRPRVPRPPRDSQPNEGSRVERGPRDSDRERGERGGERGERGGERDSRRYSDSQQLFLGNVPPTATEEELRALFSRFGPVAELRVLGRAPHPHYGFLTYESAKHAQDCLGAQPLYFPADSPDGVKLNVEEKKARASAPRDGRDPPRRRPTSSHRAFPAPPRQPYRR